MERMRYHSATLDRLLFMEAADRIEALEARIGMLEAALARNSAHEDRHRL